MKTCTTCGKEFSDETKFCPEDGSTLRSAAGTADMIGSIIADRYHVTRKLGEGGMGAVYLGEHVKMGRKSAIKVMVQSMANDPDAVARFNREAANAARINHHNVCGIYDFGETEDGTIFLAMEFIEGEALTDLLEREGALPAQRAGDILGQCTDALQAAHDLNIVHRDIKPDNIMVARTRDDQDLIKVVDFGIAKAVGGEEGQNVTKTGLVVGTPEYMSPEQLSGDVLDGRSDVYSIALVYYRMLTGVLPFKADTAQETMIKRLTDDPLPLAQASPGGNFPAELQAIMDRALQRLPTDRYETAHEFGKAVRSLMSALPDMPTGGPADADGATQLIDSADIKAEVAPPTAPTEPDSDELAATRVATAEDGRTHTPDTPQPAAPPAVEPPKKSPALAIAASVAIIAVGGTAGFMMMNRGSDDARPQTLAVTQAESTGVTQPNVTPDTATGGSQIDNGSRQNPGTPRDTGTPRGTERQTDNSGNNPSTTNNAQNDPDPRESNANGDGVAAAEIAATMTRLDQLGNEVADMFDPDPERLPEIYQTLQTVFNDFSLPDSVRASAASVALDAQLVEMDGEGICLWSSRLMRLAPSDNIQQIRTRNGC